MKIVLLCGRDINSQIVYSFLKKNSQLIGVVEDIPINKKKILRRRIKNLGFITTFSQLLFIKLITPLLKLESKKRVKEILSEIEIEKVGSAELPFISCSVNDTSSVDFINQLSPDIIVVNGTRIISKKNINLINYPLINIHVGITPKYRGVHGGYWALNNNDIKNCGVTVHLIDPGIDTGGILCQKSIKVKSTDNFITYPILQTIKGLECLKEVLEKNSLNVTQKEGSVSKLYYHPTIINYLKNRILNKIK
ncbi:formyl transferase [Polaribacter sp. IC066]|uniref:formyl transferase n=1 Tax=Polaribacter sp. IC066 TaxID=57032 RepID=UPI0011BF4F79|nr:formyl transferase [Polaribacter sp. IC066]TXD56686.1 formyl transferase [Polaribacter sp. IC066]